jgi:hypothetical protein
MMDNKRQDNTIEESNHQNIIGNQLPDEITAYRIAQRAMVDLKTAVYLLISIGPSDGYSNADIGRSLGIYVGHIGHEGHISRTILALFVIVKI